MAERRMFAKTIIDSDAFLDMPLSAQVLYFHLSMRADDDGFINNPKKIQRMIGASEDDLKLLILKSFIITFESGVVVIKHWKIHNYLRADRKKATVYPEEMALLETKENGAYTLRNDLKMIDDDSNWKTTLRQKAYLDSELPYSFDYKIRKAFTGKECPICGAIMDRCLDDGIITDNRIPTIQHNKPISKGGKHELGNISVICKQCNIEIQDQETGSLNSDDVINVWDKICQSSDSQVSVNSQTDGSIGKDRIGKDRIGKVSNRFTPPSVDEVKAYCDERKNHVDADRFVDFYTAKGWMVGKNKMKDWKACIRTWEKKEAKQTDLSDDLDGIL